MKSCFISAPYGYKSTALLFALERRGIKGIFVTELQDFDGMVTAHVASAIKSCDITLCIAETSKDLKERLFELGIAFGMGKKVILVASYDAGELPFGSSEIPSIRLSSSNPDEISDYVQEILKYGKTTPIKKKYTFTPSHPIGEYSEKLLERLHQINQKYHFTDSYRTFGRDIEKLVSETIRKSGVNVVSEFRSRYNRPDIAIWSDELAPYMANPLIVEVKGVIRNSSDLRMATEQLLRYINESNSEFGLLVYLDGIKVNEVEYDLPGQILAISVKKLISLLENISFGDIVKQLRNERIHGIGE